ncbi:MAG: FHA domain-containing protein [Chloroflexia bacterium]
MIICPYCHHQALEGTLFCPECGASLVPPEKSAAEGPTQAPAEERPPEDEARSESRTTAHITPAELRLLVLNSGRTISCPLKEVILIGRGDAAGGIFPEIDLTPDNAYLAGVSRRHARIIRRGNEFYLEDLGSLNGTFLNRDRLTAHIPVPFQDGDEIRLGNLVMRVILEKVSPSQDS